MGVSEDTARASTSHITVELSLSNMRKITRPSTIQKFTPKTNFPLVPNSKGTKRSGAISRAGKDRWPQATMVVMGGSERQVFDTEMLSVSTKSKSTFDNVKSTERSNNEKKTDLKTFLPDIVPAYTVIETNQEERNQIPARFTARSPSKLSQLPGFPKGTGNTSSHEINEGKSKLIKTIKFWRGTTPTSKESDFAPDPDKTDQKFSDKYIAKAAEVLTKQDSILQSWTEQLSVLEESSKNKYFSWHMALRERLLKHEKMHYQEAVTRISKYRQRLKQRPGLMPSKEIFPNMDAQLWKNLIQHGEFKKAPPTSKHPGVSMSPSQEWKPLVLSESETEKGQRKPPFFGKQASILNDAAKKQVKLSGNLAQSSTTKRGKTAASTDKPDTNYPIHGEGLLKDETISSANPLPKIKASSPQNKTNEAMKITNDASQNSDKNLDEEKTETRALLVDLKNQLKTKPKSTQEDANSSVNRGSTAPSQESKTGLGAKLKLLLQNSTPSQQSKRENVRFTVTASQSVRSRLKSQQGSNYRPISRPRTIGDGSLPKIHNISTPSLWKRHNKNNNDSSVSVKHRLTLAGIANRESFSSSVIGIAQKHISNRPKHAETTGAKNKKAEEVEDSSNKARPDDNSALEVVAGVTLPAGDSGHAEKKLTQEKDSPPADKSWKKKNPAFRLYTPATILQHQFGSSASAARMQEMENPQYKSLKLITSVAGKQQSPPQTPLEHFKARQRALKGKTNAKPAGKHKVLRIAVVEPPLTAKERIQRQQQIEKSMKRLTFNPTHAAVNNFTTAILNSELDLRAPSSSPVDMFFRSRNHLPHEHAERWAAVKTDGMQQGGKLFESIHPELHQVLRQVPINQIDGLSPPRHNMENQGIDGYNPYTNSNLKTNSAPKVKDLVDLQRLYHVMKKHGEAYTNGASYVYSQSPNHMQDGITKQQVMKQHTNQKNLHKMPFYYYPYKGGENAVHVIDDKGDAPLYVVTGAQNLQGNRKLGHIKQPPPITRFSTSEEQKRPDNAQAVPFRHVLTLSKNILPHWEKSHNQTKPTTLHDYQQKPKHALTVMMPKTPGISMTATLPLTQQHALEQIQEHAIQ